MADDVRRNPVHRHEWGAAGAIMDSRGGWRWRKPRPPEHFRRCDHCGCIHPEDLVEVENWKAEWADQKYGWPHKFYVDVPDRNGQLDWLGGSTGDMDDAEMARWGWKRVADLTPDEREACVRAVRDVDSYKVVGVGVRSAHHAKFYTEHLADPEIDREVKDQIYRRCGLIFAFESDGRVSWRPAIGSA